MVMSRTAYAAFKIEGKANFRAIGRKQRYGISRVDQEQMLANQRGRCCICDVLLNPDSMHLDHDHDNGVVRGFLCPRCNHLLGNALDSVTILIAAANYLVAAQKTTL